MRAEASAQLRQQCVLKGSSQGGRDNPATHMPTGPAPFFPFAFQALGAYRHVSLSLTFSTECEDHRERCAADVRNEPAPPESTLAAQVTQATGKVPVHKCNARPCVAFRRSLVTIFCHLTGHGVTFLILFLCPSPLALVLSILSLNVKSGMSLYQDWKAFSRLFVVGKNRFSDGIRENTRERERESRAEMCSCRTHDPGVR